VGDFDGDGDLDFATSNQNAGTVSVRLNDGAGNFSGTTEITVGANPEFMALGDFNKDGKLDLVTSNQNAGTLSVRFGRRRGQLYRHDDSDRECQPQARCWPVISTTTAIRTLPSSKLQPRR
jgi:hypothetical protein